MYWFYKIIAIVILAIVAVLVIFIVSMLAIVVFDPFSYMATGSETLKPDGGIAGNTDRVAELVTRRAVGGEKFRFLHPARTV